MVTLRLFFNISFYNIAQMTKVSQLLKLQLKSESKEQLSGHVLLLWLTSLIFEADRPAGCRRQLWRPRRWGYCTGPWFPAGPRSGLWRRRPSSWPCSPRNSTRRRGCGQAAGCSRRRSRWKPPGHSNRTFPWWWAPEYEDTVWVRTAGRTTC